MVCIMLIVIIVILIVVRQTVSCTTRGWCWYRRRRSSSRSGGWWGWWWQKPFFGGGGRVSLRCYNEAIAAQTRTLGALPTKLSIAIFKGRVDGKEKLRWLGKKNGLVPAFGARYDFMIL